MKSIKVFIIAFTLLLGAIAINHFRKYLILKPALEKPIVYEPVSSEISTGRGKSYYFTVLYQRKEYELSVTSSDYRYIKAGKYPQLYYSPKLDVVFYGWSVKRSLRIAIVFFCLFLIGCFSWFKKNRLFALRSHP